MSKELKELDVIRDKYVDLMSISNIMELQHPNVFMIFNDMGLAIKELTNALTPPTSDEVCEALNDEENSENVDWYYDEKLNVFWGNNDGEAVELSSRYHAGTWMKSKTRLLVCRFFESKEIKND